MTTLLRLLFPRTYKRILALGWLEGVQYELARHQPQRDDAGRFAGKGKCVR